VFDPPGDGVIVYIDYEVCLVYGAAWPGFVCAYVRGVCVISVLISNHLFALHSSLVIAETAMFRVYRYLKNEERFIVGVFGLPLVRRRPPKTLRTVPVTQHNIEVNF
jgi:hypothetical protein